MDAKDLGEATMGLIDDLAEEAPDDAEIEAVAVVVNVAFTDEDGDAATRVFMRTIDGTDRLVQVGLLFEAMQLVSGITGEEA